MKRTALMRRTARRGSQITAAMDRDQRIEARAARNANRMEILRAAPPAARGVIERVIGPAAPIPKPEAKRNAHLLAMAKDMPCLLAISGVCLGHNSRTSVACHSNSSRHGKAGARKADDHYTVWGCMACHRWLDQGTAPIEEKQAAFDLAHEAQRRAWAQIVENRLNLYPPRDRKAAQWALDQYDADTQKAAA